MTEQTETKQIPLRLPREDYEALKNLAFFTDRPMNAIVAAAVHEFLSTVGRDEQLEAMIARAQKRYRPLLDKLADA